MYVLEAGLVGYLLRVLEPQTRTGYEADASKKLVALYEEVVHAVHLPHVGRPLLEF